MPKEISQAIARDLLDAAWEAINIIDMVRGSLPREVLDGRGGFSLYDNAGQAREIIMRSIEQVEG